MVSGRLVELPEHATAIVHPKCQASGVETSTAPPPLRRSPPPSCASPALASRAAAKRSRPPRASRGRPPRPPPRRAGRGGARRRSAGGRRAGGAQGRAVIALDRRLLAEGRGARKRRPLRRQSERPRKTRNSLEPLPKLRSRRSTPLLRTRAAPTPPVIPRQPVSFCRDTGSTSARLLPSSISSDPTIRVLLRSGRHSLKNGASALRALDKDRRCPTVTV